MSLFAVNTGCRAGEICKLRWDWEVQVPELNTSVFIIPGEDVKNGDERLVVLNKVAKSVVDSVRGHHDSAELSRLLEAANRVCDRKGKQPELVVLRRLNVG